MAHKTLIGGTTYEISGGKTLVDGTAYSIAKGRTLVGGTGYDVSFSKPVTITVTLDYRNDSGANRNPADYVYIEHNGTKYITDKTVSSISFEANIGDEIYCDAESSNTDYGLASIFLNGNSVGEPQYTWNPTVMRYWYTVVSDATFSIKFSYTDTNGSTIGGWWALGTIDITDANA